MAEDCNQLHDFNHSPEELHRAVSAIASGKERDAQIYANHGGNETVRDNLQKYARKLRAAADLLNTLVGDPYGWKHVDPKDRKTWPQESGDYYVKVAGDSESCDGQTLYEYPDYTQLMYFEVYIEDGELVVTGTGPHDEEFNDGHGIVKYAKIPAATYTPLRNLDTEPEEPKGKFFLNLPK